MGSILPAAGCSPPPGGVRSGDRAQALRALVPIAAGHTASVALVAAAVAIGLAMDRVVLQVVSGMLLAVVVVIHLTGRARKPAAHIGLTLWSFMMSTAHGAGLMLVPALIPLCMGNAPAMTTSGALTMALAAVAVHTAAMLAVTGLIASLVCRGLFFGNDKLAVFLQLRRHRCRIANQHD